MKTIIRLFIFVFSVSTLHAQIPTSGQVSYYKFSASNSSSTTLTDENVNANNGIVANGLGFNSNRNGVANKSVSLGGSGNSYNYVAINNGGNYPSISAMSDMTLSLWYKKEDATGASTRAVWGITDVTRYYELDYDAVNNVFVFTHYNGTTVSTALQSSTLTVGTWYNITMTISPTNNTCSMYVNAVLQGSNTQIITKPITPGIYLSRRPYSTLPNFPASFDDFYIYNRVLTGMEISAIYSYCSAPKPSSSGNSICGSGTVNLSASGASSYRWYADSTGGSILASINSFTTPSLSVTDTFYVANFASGCESKRALSIATIKTPPATFSISGANSVASGVTQTYSVTASLGSSYTWQVVGGTGSSTTNSISVTWNTSGLGYTTGYLHVTELGANGCSGVQKDLPVTVQDITSTTSPEIQEQTKIYPNPSKGNLIIETPEPMEKVILTNTLGLQESFYNNSFVSGFKGIVMAEIHTPKGIVYKKLLLE